YALRAGIPVVPVFIFDKDILNELSDKSDLRVNFIHEQICKMQEALTGRGCSMHVMYGSPKECYRQLVDEYDIEAVYANHDYEPYAIKRDLYIAELLASKGIDFCTYKDQVFF